MIFDSHAHYDDRAFDADREEMLSELMEKGIGGIVNAGASRESVGRTMELSHQYPYLYAAVGIHPEHTGEMREQDLDWLRRLLADPKAVAVGEIGLDYYWGEPDREIQKEWFIRQLHLAEEVGKPVVIHSRDAAEDTLTIMEREYGGGRPAYIHCFSYSKEMARRFLKLGCMIGIGGVVTFKNAKKVKEAVAETPLNRILIETDCPYLAPTPHRGERNSSLFLPLIIQEIAKIKGISPSQVEEAAWNNAQSFYGL